MNHRASLKLTAFLLVVLCCTLLFACSEKESPEEQVRQFLSLVIQATEAGDVLAMRGLIADDYADDGGRDKRGLLALATGYFLRNKNIHLFTQIDEIQFPTVGKAQVKVFVAMTGSPVTSAEGLFNLRADLYRFDLTLMREDGGWLLKKAAWKRVAIDEVLED
jgi:hypothetical protein